MARVDEVLHNLDQLNLAVSLIRQTGAFHRRFQGFKPKYFKVIAYIVLTFNITFSFLQSQHFEEPFLTLVKHCLGTQYTAQMEVKLFLKLCCSFCAKL